jgi:uncharacterized protein
MKRIFFLISALLLIAFLSVLAFAVVSGEKQLMDQADLLTDGEEASLLAEMERVSARYSAEISLVTVPALYEDIEEYAEDLYDSDDYGYGYDKDGIMLVLSMDPREFWILCNGYAWSAVGYSGVAEITSDITPDLSAGLYASAFETYVEDCEYYLNSYEYGGVDSEYEYDSSSSGESLTWSESLLVSLVIGLIAGLVYALILKGQLKSVKRRNEADSYVKHGSLMLRQSGDYFMYRNLVRTERPKNNSSGSSSHRSSGSFRGGGGGRF